MLNSNLIQIQKKIIQVSLGELGVIHTTQRETKDKQIEEITTTMQVGKIFFPNHSEFKKPTTLYVFLWLKIMVMTNSI